MTMCRALQESGAPLSRAGGRVTVGASRREPSYEIATHATRPHERGGQYERGRRSVDGDAGPGAIEIRADDRAVELLGRDGRSGASGSQREVLPVADVRLSGRYDRGWPAIPGRRTGQ